MNVCVTKTFIKTLKNTQVHAHIIAFFLCLYVLKVITNNNKQFTHFRIKQDTYKLLLMNRCQEFNKRIILPLIISHYNVNVC